MTTLPTSADFTTTPGSHLAMRTSLAQQRDYLAGLLGADGLPATALVALGSLGSAYVAKTGAYTATTTDRGKVINASGTWTLSLPATATAGSGFALLVKNGGSGVITLDPSGAELVDGATTLALSAGRAVLLACTGTAWVVLEIPGKVTQTATDTTVGRLLKVGDFGVGADGPSALANLDDFTTRIGVYKVDGTTVLGTKPATTTTGDAVLVLRPAANQQTQIYSNPNNGLTYIRKSNASTSWGPWRLIYESGNLLGTVSQTAGAPTGAVIERGANANGEYVKFADGTLICTTSGITLVYSTADLINYTWTFPAPCVVGSFPVVSAALSPLTADYAGLARRDLCAFAQSAGTAGAVVSFTRPSGATRAFIAGDAAANVRLVVTGRWF